MSWKRPRMQNWDIQRTERTKLFHFGFVVGRPRLIGILGERQGTFWRECESCSGEETAVKSR